MKALVYTNPNEMQLLDRPYPSLDQDEVIIKIESVGICGSDEGNADHAHDAPIWLGHAGGSRV